MSGLLALEVLFKKAVRKADDSVTISFETQGEVNTEQMAFIDGFRKSKGNLVYSRDKINAGDIPKSDTKGEAKTPAQELRFSLYAKWKAMTDRKMTTEDWDSYYTNAMMGFKRAVDRSHPDNEE